MAILRKLTDAQRTPRWPVRHVFEQEALIAVGGDRPLRLLQIDRALQQKGSRFACLGRDGLRCAGYYRVKGADITRWHRTWLAISAEISGIERQLIKLGEDTRAQFFQNSEGVR